MCRVLNARQVGKQSAGGRVYVGRPSKWGNPFVIGRDGTREEVIAKYRAWIVRQPALMAALHELRGKDLVCWCAPERCHAEVLIELADGKRRAGRNGLACHTPVSWRPQSSQSLLGGAHFIRSVSKAHRRHSPSCNSSAPTAGRRTVKLSELATEMSNLKGAGRLLRNI